MSAAVGGLLRLVRLASAASHPPGPHAASPAAAVPRARRRAARPFPMSSERDRHGAARATVEGDPGVANPGLDAENLLVRGEGVQGDDVSTFLNAGLTEAQVDEVLRDHPLVETTYDLIHEVQPRINYMRFLVDNDRMEGESVAQCVVRQPQSLERRFELVHECDSYVAVNKPWCVRLDTPRGWPGKTRFTEKYPGDLSVEDWLERKYVHNGKWDQVRFCHQLDNATSGVLRSAASKKAAGAAARLFRERRARKTYLAPCSATPRRTHGRSPRRWGGDPHDPKGSRSASSRRWRRASEARRCWKAKQRIRRGEGVRDALRGFGARRLTLRGKFSRSACGQSAGHARPPGGATRSACTRRTAGTPSSATTRTRRIGTRSARFCTRTRWRCRSESGTIRFEAPEPASRRRRGRSGGRDDEMRRRR